MILYYIVLPLYLTYTITISATSTIGFYADGGCQNEKFTVQTDTQAGNGDCGEVVGINSIKTDALDRGCSCKEHLAPIQVQLTNNATSNHLLRFGATFLFN